MGSRVKKPKNRFLPGAHVSEATLARILFCWLQGELYSAIPSNITQKGGAVDDAMKELRKLMGKKFELAENNRTSISRQACHSIIDEVSLQVIVRSYQDRIAHLEDLLDGDDPLLTAERRRMIELIGSEPSDEEKVSLLDEMKDQSVEDYIIRWGKIVLVLSANVVPYEAMRTIKGVKPFDLIQNPLILASMQERYRNFRGYKIPALKTHIAHYFCLRHGADYLLRDEGGPTIADLHKATKQERSEYWFKYVIRSLACLLLELETGMTYLRLREEILREG